MKKLNTEESTIYIVNYFKDLGYRTEKEDWTVKKKYKNLNGILCRDFYNEKTKKKAILLENTEVGSRTVIEDENYDYFYKVLKDKPIFYFTPAISNDGLVFVFQIVNSDTEVEQVQEILEKKLSKLFEKKNYLIFEDNKDDQSNFVVSITGMDLGLIVSTFESNQIKYSEILEKKIDDDNFNYRGITPDAAWVYYKFPEYILFNQEKSINEIFALVSKKDELVEKDLSIIKVLLKKITPQEFSGVKKIALSFKKKNSDNLIKIFEDEESRIRAKSLIEDLVLRKGK